jgi:hypothetical protein
MNLGIGRVRNSGNPEVWEIQGFWGFWGGSGDFGESRDFGNNAAIIYKNFYAKKYKKNNCGGAEGSIT